MCVLHGERHDGDKFVLTYSSIEHDKCPVMQGVTRAKVSMFMLFFKIESAKVSKPSSSKHVKLFNFVR